MPVLLPPLVITADLGSLLTIALSVLSLSTLAGYGLLRGRVLDLREQLRDERDARASLTGRFDESQRENVDLHGKVKVLEGIVTGEVHWVALGDKLEQHHVEAKEHWARSEERVEANEQLLIEIRDALRSR